MSIFTERTSKKIDIVFVLALFTLFAATSFILVLIGAKQYRFVTNIMNENYTERATSSYLAEKIRQHDSMEGVAIANLQGTPALSLSTTEENVSFTTYIYYYENALRELVVTENSVFTLSSGQEIIALQGINFTLIENSLIRTEITATNGKKQVLFFPLHCSSQKEEL